MAPSGSAPLVKRRSAPGVASGVLVAALIGVLWQWVRWADFENPQRGAQVPGDRPRRTRRGLALACWLPVATLVAIELYVRSFEGWGAWAAAPLFLLPLAFSVAIAGAGAALWLLDLRAGSARASSLIFIAVALIPVFWLFVRRYVM